MSYAGQHETFHGTAFRTKKFNEVAAFLLSLPCFEFAHHERCLHKSHHTWTNDPERDPELTSFFSKRNQRGFRKVADNLADYWKESLYLHEPVYCVICAGFVVECLGVGSKARRVEHAFPPRAMGTLSYSRRFILT